MPINRCRCAFGVLTAVLCAAPADGQSTRLLTTGNIWGTVTSGPNKPVVGATVSAVRTFPIAGVPGPRIQEVATDSQGKYQLNGLSPASYLVCVNAPGTALLDPCHWAAKPPFWNLQPGHTATVDVAMETGALLQIRVDDPSQRASQKENQNKGAAFIAGTWARSGTFLVIPEIYRDAKGRNLRIAVPQGRDIQFVFNPDGLDVEDKDHKPVKAQDGPRSLRLDQAEQVLQFKVK